MADAIIRECRALFTPEEMEVFLRILASGVDGRLPPAHAKMIALRMAGRCDTTLQERLVHLWSPRASIPYTAGDEPPPYTLPPPVMQSVPPHIVAQQGVLSLE